MCSNIYIKDIIGLDWQLDGGAVVLVVGAKDQSGDGFRYIVYGVGRWDCSRWNIYFGSPNIWSNHFSGWEDGFYHFRKTNAIAGFTFGRNEYDEIRGYFGWCILECIFINYFFVCLKNVGFYFYCKWLIWFQYILSAF